MAAVTTFYSEDDLHIAFWRNVVVADVGGDMTVAHVQALGRSFRTMRSAHSGGIVVFAAMRPGVPVSSPEVRAESVRNITDLGTALLSMMLVIEDTGVFSQVMRTVIRGLNVMMRQSKMTTAATIDDGIRVVLPHVSRLRSNEDVTDELRSAIVSMRARTRLSPFPPMKEARKHIR